MPYNTEKIRHAYKSKNNLTRENQVILLVITDDKKWHCLAVESLSALFRKITDNNNGDFYCSKNLKSIKKYARIMIIAM